MKFTDKGIKGLIIQDKTYVQWSEELSGYGVRISKKGKKTFIFRYKFKGQSRLITIGSFPKISLAGANKKYGELAEQVKHGADPWAEIRDTKRQRNLSPTVKQFAETFITNYCIPNKKSWKEDQRILNVYVIPEIGRLKMIDTTRLDVRTIINGIYDKGSPIMSNRVLACIRKMFAFAVEEDLLEFNVCTAIPKKAAEKSCERTLSHEEIKILWELLPNTDVGNATKLLLISGQRTGETRQMEWSELDNTFWTIPPEKQKKRKNKPTKPHLVPLPTLAMEIIQAQKFKTGGSTYVFAGRIKGREEEFGDRCISEKAISRAFRRIIEKLGWQRTTVHDLRRTMRSELSRLKVNAVVSEKLLNHALPGLIDTYDMHAYFDEKAIALQKWSDCLESIVHPERKKSNIIELPGAKLAM